MPVSIALRAAERCIGLHKDLKLATGTACVRPSTSHSDLLNIGVQWTAERVIVRVATALFDGVMAFWIEKLHEAIREQSRSLPEDEQRPEENRQHDDRPRCKNDRQNDTDRRTKQQESELNQPVRCAVVRQAGLLEGALKLDVSWSKSGVSTGMSRMKPMQLQSLQRSAQCVFFASSTPQSRPSPSQSGQISITRRPRISVGRP